MFALLSGIVVRAEGSRLVLMQSGIGFELLCPNAARYSSNSTIQLHTYLHWSADHGPSLYGFEHQAEKDLFLMLIDCPGIGPKLGIAMLEQMPLTSLVDLIVKENAAGLSQIKGLGAKKAEIICTHLKDKVCKLALVHPQLSKLQAATVWNDLHDTLVSLHYSPAEIKQATALVKETLSGQELAFDVLLRKTLMLLAKK
jgi:Holliday junction DNA helicase RuvA